MKILKWYLIHRGRNTAICMRGNRSQPRKSRGRGKKSISNMPNKQELLLSALKAALLWPPTWPAITKKKSQKQSTELCHVKRLLSYASNIQSWAVLRVSIQSHCSQYKTKAIAWPVYRKRDNSSHKTPCKAFQRFRVWYLIWSASSSQTLTSHAVCWHTSALVLASWVNHPCVFDTCHSHHPHPLCVHDTKVLVWGVMRVWEPAEITLTLSWMFGLFMGLFLLGLFTAWLVAKKTAWS